MFGGTENEGKEMACQSEAEKLCSLLRAGKDISGCLACQGLAGGIGGEYWICSKSISLLEYVNSIASFLAALPARWDCQCAAEDTKSKILLS